MQILISLILSSHVWASGLLADKPEEMKQWAQQAAERCLVKTHPPVYADDFRWGVNLLEMADLFRLTYESDKRLNKRVYFSPETGRFLGQTQGTTRDINVPIHFLFSLKKHIESALALEYAQWVFFPDMGHNHFLIPDEIYKKISRLPLDESREAMLELPELKVLYHTAEQLEMTKRVDDKHVVLEDTWTQWRYYTRNIVGDNRGMGQLDVRHNLRDKFNTVNAVPGYYHYSGVNMSAAQHGCFSYEHQGKTFYFDVSFFDLDYANPG